MNAAKQNAEQTRLDLSSSREENWQRWGPYLSERQWGTVREDYSDDQDAWAYFPHDHSRSRAYRWGEDGLLGWCDRECRLCFGIALWNTHDPILKERLFGLSGPEGNHGEDVKECYYYCDSTPTYSYAKALYKYPQGRFPYEDLVESNQNRSKEESEYELIDTGAFAENRYFDCQVQYAKNAPDDILIRVTITNCGPDRASITVLPQWWFRNTWSWKCTHEGCQPRPSMRLSEGKVLANHESLGQWTLAADWDGDGQAPAGDESPFLFTDNVTNPKRHGDVAASGEQYYKDAFHEYVIGGNKQAVNPDQSGTKVAFVQHLTLDPGQSVSLRLRMAAGEDGPSQWFGSEFDEIFTARIAEADAFYEPLIGHLDAQPQQVARQAYAGLLWSKQFYHYCVIDWIDGDPSYGNPSPERLAGRNNQWRHLFNRDVISMPDKWEYPWYAAWDLAFHMIPMADVDLDFAKEQLILFLREWYQHPNGALPAYEWALSDVNPPVHCWACWQVYQREKTLTGKGDKEFLARVFQKLLLNFTWWVNRKDPQGKNIFSGGFLGLDNIGVFDRSRPLPGGGELVQADATAWMAFFCGNMLCMAIELAEGNNAYADMASKFLEHYLSIADAANSMQAHGLWDDQDGFYYDMIMADAGAIPLRVRSLVGLIPLCTPVVLDEAKIAQLPGFRKRTQWYLQNRVERASHMSYLTRTCRDGEEFGYRLLALPTDNRLRRLLKTMLDETEFLSPHGIRSMSALHASEPFVFENDHTRQEVRYVPGESDSYMFGGNSNWRGPIWFPMNYLIVEALSTYHVFYGDSFRIECPSGSGNMMNLAQIADELRRRLIGLFIPDDQHRRPCHGEASVYADDPRWRELVLFYEYFHGDNGRGLGASHQTGWTSLVASMLGASSNNPKPSE